MSAAARLLGMTQLTLGRQVSILEKELGETEAKVVQALPSLEPISFPVWLTTHRELNSSRRIRMVFDLLATELV